MNALKNSETLTLTPYQAAEENHKAIKVILSSMQRKAIELGYFLNEAQSQKYYKTLGYSDIYDYAEQEFGLGKTNTKNYQAINRAFTDSYENGRYKGYSLSIDIRYKGYSTSQLIEMLPLTPTDRCCISSDMTVSEIRDYKKILESPSVIGLDSCAESYIKIKDDPKQAVKNYRENKRDGSLIQQAEKQKIEEPTTVAEGQMIVSDDGEITEYHQTGAPTSSQTSDFEKEGEEIEYHTTPQDIAQQKIEEIIKTADDVAPQEVFGIGAGEEDNKVFVTDGNGNAPVLLQIEDIEKNILEYLTRWSYEVTSNWLGMDKCVVPNSDVSHFIACNIYHYYDDVFNGRKPEVKKSSRCMSES